MAALAPLAPSEVRVFYASSAQLASQDRVARCRALLSPDERAREQRFRFEEDRRTYLLAHALTRRVLAELSGERPLALEFELGPHGRPELVRPRTAPRLRFNLSHTRGLVACAVALEHDVGVDVEHVDRRVDIDQLAPSVFSPAERAGLDRLDGERRRARFFELWTLKEAYIKAVGKGLALRLTSISLELDGVPAPRIAFAGGMADDPAAWSFRVRNPAPGHTLAVAARIADLAQLAIEPLDPA